MQMLEIIVKANNWDDAVSILEKVGIDKKSRTDYRDVDGQYLVTVVKSTPLSSKEYEKIKQNSHIAIQSDTLSKSRTLEVMSVIYDVEVQLRKLLLHIPDLIETYYDIFKNNSKYTVEYTKQRSITIKNSLDPITSQLTLGEMCNILGYDLSWSGRGIIINDLVDLTDESEDFESFKKNMANKIRPLTIWDIIADNLLTTNKSWQVVNSEIRKLKKFRDASAHHQVITEDDKTDYLQTAKSLSNIITPKETISKIDVDNLSGISTVLAKWLEELNSEVDIKRLYEIQKQLNETSIRITPEMQNVITANQRYAEKYKKFYENVLSKQIAQRNAAPGSIIIKNKDKK